MQDALYLLKNLPAAVYTTDAQGRITFFNQAAAELWGREPQLGAEHWCGSFRLFWPDGRPMRHDECPMAEAMRERRPSTGVATAERPDGSRFTFRAFPTPILDADGELTGGLNLLIDITEQAEEELARIRLAAIVEGSDDAIISKTLDGVITSWNGGAARIFGYAADEMIGQRIIRLIPPELRGEEEDILARLRRGERIDHFDTIRIGKDGRPVHISLTISPLCDRAGNIVGASKVARDVTERKQAEKMQRLLFNELNHRVKNMLASIQAICSQSLRTASSPDAFVLSFNGRIRAMARAHELLVQGRMEGADMFGLVRDQVVLGAPDSDAIMFSGPHVVADDRVAVQLALVLHELATNARKYGGLSRPEGRLSISWRLETTPSRALLLEWRESGVSGLVAPTRRGFGTRLIERSLDANGGEATVHYGADGLMCSIRLPLPATSHSPMRPGRLPDRSDTHGPAPDQAGDAALLRGRRVLVVEDEPLVAMEMEALLQDAGCHVIGPVGTAQAGLRLIEKGGFEIALLDANLCGEPVGDLAAALQRNDVPFAFVTGYGREALPAGFEQAQVLTKPFSEDELMRTLTRLASGSRADASIIKLRPRI